MGQAHFQTFYFDNSWADLHLVDVESSTASGYFSRFFMDNISYIDLNSKNNYFNSFIDQYVTPFDAKLVNGNDYTVNLLLKKGIMFDYLLKTDSNQDNFNLDILVLGNSGQWELIGQINSSEYSNSSDYLTRWNTAWLNVPSELVDQYCQIKFHLNTFSSESDPAVYLENITTPAPEPSSMLLLVLGLVGLAGVRRKFKQ